MHKSAYTYANYTWICISKNNIHDFVE